MGWLKNIDEHGGDDILLYSVRPESKLLRSPPLYAQITIIFRISVKALSSISNLIREITFSLPLLKTG